MRKFFVLLTVLLLALLVLTGCTKKDGGVTLTLWHIWVADSDAMKPAFERVVSGYRAAHPEIKLVVDGVENEAYKTKIRSAVAANEAADVFFYWGAGRMKGFVDAGALLPLDEYLDAETRGRILPGGAANMTFNGKLWALPFTQWAGTFFVNQDLFDRNGLSVPATWDKLVAVCQAFIAKGITPFAVGAKEPWTIAMYFDLMTLRQAGYTATNAALTKTGSFNTPDMVEAARKLRQLVDIGAFGGGAMGLGATEAEFLFYEGKVPMYIIGSWAVGNMSGNNSKIKAGNTIKIYPFPVLGPKGSAKDMTGGAVDIFAVNARTKYPKEAVDLLKYLCENMSAELYQSGSALPTWKAQVDESQIDPMLRNLVNQLQEVDTYTLAWDTLLEGQDAQVYLEALSSLFAGLITPEQFAETMQTIVK